MTLVITAINPKIGIWQSSDHALSRTETRTRIDPDWCKQVAIYAEDGFMLLGYSGLARSPSRLSIAEHIAKAAAPLGAARTIKGDIYVPARDITVDETLERIRAHMSTQMARWPADYQSAELRISGGVMVGGQHRYVAIMNSTSKESPSSTFRMWEPDGIGSLDSAVLGQGSGDEKFIGDGYAERVAQIIAKTPRDVTNYLKLLTSVNRKVAGNRYDITQWSQAAFMPNTRFPLHGLIYHPLGVRQSRSLRPMRIVIGGCDITSATQQFMRSSRGMSWEWSLDKVSDEIRYPPE